jgi:N-hydroxyarylamine O-acetyltransferase
VTKENLLHIHDYLERIAYQGELTPSLQTLQALQMAHLLTVPFENLSIHAPEPIILNDKALFEKIVERRRGGFCYELNGLFTALLRALGFDVIKLSAGVAMENGRYTPYFDHMLLMVTLDERWLVEVGFGDSFRQPLRVADQGVQAQNGRFYQLIPHGDTYTLMEKKGNKDWAPQYRFNLTAYEYSDYATMCHHNQTSPESHFTKGRICTLATVNGRKTLSELRFITTSLDGDRHEQQLADEMAFAQMLEIHFGIRINQFKR